MNARDDANLVAFLIDLARGITPEDWERVNARLLGDKARENNGRRSGNASDRQAVHHINGDPYDQRPENLRIVPATRWPVKAWWRGGSS